MVTDSAGHPIEWWGRREPHAFRTNTAGGRIVALCGTLPDERDERMSRRTHEPCRDCHARYRQLPRK